ncbi:pentatricopeptide repeat-containing protein At3g12770-like [Cryptomeria japonica]|uniref:pentatricopeptide repeat-containing protein At3g12770-like n=1 Tax=Cryptomeria japonica TaxID=3369 RepID=UPI0027DA3498|nr:pentatricopeptide repeat-containing protein At3g12770-like [Cryptomeria japonica]
MQLAGVKPDSTTFSSLLPACAKMGALEQGMNLHQDIIERGLWSDVSVANALIDMYAKFGRIHKSSEIFDKILQRDMVSWNSMIGGYAQNGFFEKAMETFNQMLLADIMPDFTTFASILPACPKMEALQLGMNLYQSIIKSGFLSGLVTANALIDMYAKCLTDCLKEMPSHGTPWLRDMHKMSILPACTKIGALKQSMGIHQFIIKSGFSSDVVVTNALIDVYAKCGNIHGVREEFDKMLEKDVISWNALVLGYAQNGFCNDALKLFEQMQHFGTHPGHGTPFTSRPRFKQKKSSKMPKREKKTCLYISQTRLNDKDTVLTDTDAFLRFFNCKVTQKHRHVFALHRCGYMT